jgi:hypothetical protein
MQGCESRPAGPRDLDIGVIYTNERRYMAPLIRTLARSGEDVGMRLMLVDNASHDGVEEWSGIFADTVVIRNGARDSYAANLNRVLAASTARYTLLLNTDMYFDPHEQCLAKMVKFMDEQADCGLSICRLYHPDGSYGFPARQFPTLAAISARRLGLRKLFVQALSDHLCMAHSHHDVFPCDWVSGCLMMVRRQAALEAGPLDTGFRKYFEDVDFCARMAAAGWRVMFNGGTFGYHWEQRSSARRLSADVITHLRSYARWLTKWGFRPQVRATSPAYASGN